jgi:hypothetical protein
LKAPGFNPWNLKHDFLVSKFARKFNLYHYNGACINGAHVICHTNTKGWVGHFSRDVALKTPIDDSQYGPCNQSDTRE